MSEKKAVTREVCVRYRKARRTEKKAILDEFTATTAYNRKYAIRVLNAAFKQTTVIINGKPLNVRAAATRPKNRLGKNIYTEVTIAALRSLWVFFWYKCGKYLAPLIRAQMSFLEASRKPDFHLTPEVREQLLKISPAQIDRLLRADKTALRGKGISGTRLGEAALLRQIPIRTHYSDAERHIPGFFQTDTVHHCQDSDAGEFILTLTATDVASGWVELRPLRNKAHKWTLEALKEIHAGLPFPLLELHSDNGKEFITRDTIDWWRVTESLCLTRSRSRHKNDNCYAEQKNNAFVRNYVGYSRHDTEAELRALRRVYQSLCPLLNFFIPNKKLLSKTSVGSKTVKKYDRPKTPYQRLLESALPEEVKERLRGQYALLNPVSLQYDVHKAVAALFRAYRAKVTFSL
jgi:hypothetical protein